MHNIRISGITLVLVAGLCIGQAISRAEGEKASQPQAESITSWAKNFLNNLYSSFRNKMGLAGRNPEITPQAVQQSVAVLAQRQISQPPINEPANLGHTLNHEEARQEVKRLLAIALEQNTPLNQVKAQLEHLILRIPNTSRENEARIIKIRSTIGILQSVYDASTRIKDNNRIINRDIKRINPERDSELLQVLQKAQQDAMKSTENV